MVFTGTDWTTVSTGVGVVLAVLAGGSKLWKKVETADPQLVHELPKKAVEVADEAAEFVKHIVTSPLFAGLAAKGKVEAHHVLAKFQDSQLAMVVAKALAAFGKSWDEMSEIEKGTLLTVVQTEMSRLGLSVTNKQITSVVQTVDTGIKVLVPVAKDAAERTSVIKATVQPDTAPQSEASQATAQ